MEIHQLLPNLDPADAISNHARALQRLLISWGYRSEIYAHSVHPEMAQDCHALGELRPTPRTTTIYHYSTLCPEASRVFVEARGKRAILYHNITPQYFFTPYSDALYYLVQGGRANLGQFRTLVDMALAVSPYNCAELAAAGYVNPRVLPVLVEFERFAAQPPCPATLRRFGDGWKNFLFVGRLAPHKRQEDVIRAFAWYNRFIERRSRLILVGSPGGLARYAFHLRAVIGSLEMEDYVFFAGRATLAELVAYYRLADVFLCLSEHEGFCVPLLESMYHNVPVIAYACTGVPDTLADAGILVKDKDYPVVAEMAHLLLSDDGLRGRVLCRQRERLADFNPTSIALRFKSYVEEMVAS